MLKKGLAGLALSLLIVSSGLAQSPDNVGFSRRYSAGASFWMDFRFDLQDDGQEDFRSWQISPGLWLGIERIPSFRHRVALSGISASRSSEILRDSLDQPFFQWRSSWAFRAQYEVDFIFLANRPSTVKPFIGLGISTRFTREWVLPPESPMRFYPASDFRFFLDQEVIPGVQVNVSHRIFLECAVPVTIGSMRYRRYTEEIEKPGPGYWERNTALDYNTIFVQEVKFAFRATAGFRF